MLSIAEVVEKHGAEVVCGVVHLADRTVVGHFSQTGEFVWTDAGQVLREAVEGEPAPVEAPVETPVETPVAPHKKRKGA